MAKTSTQIEIPVSLKASLEGLKEVQTQVSSALDKAGKNTTLGKTLAKELSTTAAKFGEIDEILLSPTIDESGLKRLEQLANQISSHFTQSFAKIDFSSFEQFATEDQLTRMRELQELTRKQRRDLEAINKHGSQERTDTYLVRTDNEVALNHMRNYKGFDATQTLSKNQQAMERLSQSHERTIASMKKQLEEYDQKANESFNAWDAADKRVKVLEPQVATLRKDSYAATFYDKIGRMNTRISANPETVNPRISSIEKELGSALRSIEAGGVIATEARDALKDWITHTFTNVNPTEASQMVGMTVNKLLEKLMEKIFGQGYEADREGGYDFSHSALLARGQDFADKSVKRLNAKHSTASASDLALVNQQKIKELREAQAEATKQENAAEHYMDLGMALETQIAETQQAANHTRFLAQELGRYAEAAKRAAQASKQGEINDSEQAQRDYVTQAKQEQADNYAPSREKYNTTRPGLDAGFQEANDSKDAAKAAAAEAEDFKNHLKQSITHWASAQQIINVVKDGIRQAYQDIKALDSAMTNIAVVTDMSIGDLWGKINEYMSIAKQYGVTTQGVYEVSQLYYQQGLSTSKVMAATTETLKMARIAGMDYAEAADAMTVAIRAFKMEMTDAEHVTDVYSKVAAVTASDSEELAIAMSKTASSAESVGSSFENTTAMLAVMIETTRESAQNLGSALKSIISRYGEMKVGLTVDSEGEEIDYNKVDTALKSVGISIKDAQGQFRDFDDVIFELSEKWDGLDKNTQRYIATIMAGNRQQSRFIALVDNWKRLDEVANAAQNSEDAGLLQYAKTLDSLDTKINNIKTSFQEFYMSIMNGPFFGAILTFINNLLQGLNQFSTLGSIINIVGIVRGLKSGLTALTNLFSNSFGGIISGWQATQKRWLNLAIKSGRERGAAERRAYEQGYNTGSAGPTQTNVPGGGSTTSPYGKNYKQRRAEYRQMSWADRRQYGIQNGKVDWKRSSWGGGKVGQGIAVGGALVGTAANTAGAALSGAGHHEAGAVTSAIGNIASFASMGAAAGPWGVLIGAVAGLAVSVPDLVKAFDTNNQLQREYEKAQKEAKEAEVKKAEEVNKYNTLKDLLQQYDKAKSQRGNSDEDYNNWININSKLAEMYPQLISYIDAEGNAIVDVTNRTEILSSAMNNAAKASELYYKAKENEYKAQMAMNANHKYSDRMWDHSASYETYERLGFRVDRPNREDVPAKVYTPDGTQVANVEGWVEFTSETLVDTATQLGVNLDNILLAAQGVDVELTELESEWLNFFTSADGLNKKVFTQKDGVITGWHENIGNYFAGNTGLQQLNSTQQKDLADAVYWKTEASRSDDNLTQMDGANALIASYILSTQENVKTAQDIRNLTVEQYNNAIASLVDEYEALNLKSREFINDLYNNLDGMSLMDLENAFSQYGIGGNLANTFLSTWYEQNYSRVTRYGNALFQKNAEGKPLKDFEDYSVWSAKEENKGKTKQQYYEAAIAHYRSLGDQIDQSLLDFVINSSDAAVEGYISALERENDIIAGGGMASKAAAGRLGYISQVVEASAEDGTYGELTKAQTDEFIALLGADDAGTQEWAERVREFAKKYNVVIPELESFIYENFTTRMQSLLDGIDDFKKETEDFFAKAEEGFTFDEALKFLKDLDLSEEEFSTIFEIKDGKILLKDFNSAFGMLYDKQFKNLASITSSVNTMVTEIGKDSYEFMDSMRIGHKAEIDNIDSLEERAAMKTDLASDLVFMLGIDTGLADEAADWLIDNVNATDAEFIEWLKSKGVVAEQATEYLKQARTRQLASFSFDNWFKDSYGDKNTLKGLTESPTLEAIKDYAIDNNLVTGVDTDADGLIDSYNWDEYFSTLQGVAIDAFGNMTITDAEAFYLSVTGKTKDMLTAVDWELINLLGSQIDASNEAAIEAFGSIGASAAKGKADYTEVFAKTMAQAGWTEDQFDKEMKKILSSAASGDATSYDHVKSIIKDEWDTQGRVYTDDELIDATDAFINGYADGQTENAKRFLELSQKQLKGTITQAELKELSEIEIDDQWASDLADVLATEGLSTVQKYGAIVEAAIESGLPWPEIEQTIKDGYSKQLEGLLNEELGFNDSGDTLSAISGMEKAAGHYTNDILSNIFNQASAETGKAVDLTFFRDYFTFDQETKTWVVKAGKNVNDFLQETYGEDVPEWLIGAFDASETQKTINDAIKRDNNLTSIPEKFTSLISDPLKATTDELIKFWESLLDRELTTDELAQVEKARDAAIAGDSATLHSMLLGWMDYAEAETGIGYDVRWDSMKQASFDKNAQDQANIEKWLKGEGTIDDFEKVWMAEAGEREGAELVEFIQGKISSMRGAFIDTAGNLIITDYEEFMDYLVQEELVDEATLTQYTAEIQDTTLKTIKSIFEYINKAIEGTLTATELRDMGQAVVNSGTMSADEWHTFASQNVSRVGTGYKMNEAAAFALQVNTGNYDFEDLVNQFDNLDEVNEMLIELQENSAEWGDEFVRAAERVLESIKLIKAQDPKDAMFNWMNQDMEGWAGTYESTIGSIGKANDIINASMESGTMGLNDFYNMSQIVGQHLTGTQLDAWNQYRDAVYATATTVDGGTVSLTAGGKSMEYALNNMRTSTEAYYQDIAKQQIDFIDKQIAALETQKKVEEALKNQQDIDGDGQQDYQITYQDLVVTSDERNADGTIKENAQGYNIDESAARAAYFRYQEGISDEEWANLSYQKQQEYYTREFADSADEAHYQNWFVEQFMPRMDGVMKAASAAGMNLTDPAVVQSLANAALARMGVDGYKDIFSNSEELNALTTIRDDVAAIKKEVAADVTTTTEDNPPPPPPPENTEEPKTFNLEGSGTEDFDNGTWMLNTSTEHLNDVKRNEYLRKRYAEIDKETDTGLADPTGSGNDTANLKDPRIKQEELSIEAQALEQSQQQTQHQVNIDTNTNATVTALGTTNSLLQQVVDNTAPESKTNAGSEGEEETTTSTEDTNSRTPNYMRLQDPKAVAYDFDGEEPEVNIDTEEPKSSYTGQSFNPQRTPLRAIAYEDGTDVSNFIGANAALLSQVDGHYLEEYMATRVHANSGWGLSDSSTFVQAYQMLMQSMGTPMPSAPYYSNEELQQLPTLLSQRSYAITNFAREVLGGQDRATLSLLQQNMQNLERYGSEGFDPNHPLYRYNFSPSRRFVHELGYWQSWVPKSEADKAEVLNEYNLTGKRYSRKYTLDEERTLQSAYNHGMISDKQWTNWQQIINNDKYLYAATHGVNFKGAGTPDEFTGIDERPEGTPSNIAMHHYKGRNAGDTDRSSIFANHEAAFKEALYWNDVRAGKYDNWTEDTPDITTLYDPSTAVAPQEHAAARLTTAGDLARDLQQTGDAIAQGVGQVIETAKPIIQDLTTSLVSTTEELASLEPQDIVDAIDELLTPDFNSPEGSKFGISAETWNFIISAFNQESKPSFPPLDERTVVDKFWEITDDAEVDDDGRIIDYEAVIAQMSEAIGQPLSEWLPVLQNAVGSNGAAWQYGIYNTDEVRHMQGHANIIEQIDTEATVELAETAAQQALEAAQKVFDKNPAEMTIGGNTATAESKFSALKQNINETQASIAVDLNVQPATVSVGVSGIPGKFTFKSTTAEIAEATGNVNGLAFATGTEKLIAGANLANKSLVGELGPELAVYNGQYHLLGANGAEFANIPSNAIIFNHKQTEGILKGQANIRGRVKDGGEAFAEGNVSGPAYGSGNIDEAIKALQEARAMWQSLLDRDLGQLAGISSNKGGGGGSVAKAYSTELQEWYNLLRQIADIEAEINQLVAERTNLQNEYNGEAVVRNLRQQQTLLNQQLETQKTLLVYQNAQLKRQAKEINTDEILSQFIEVNEDGIVQYLKGNEAFGGKGTLEVLSWLNDASTKEQLAFIKQIGFDKTKEAYDQNGKMLKDDKLVQAFFDYFDTAIKEYDGLQDTVDKSTTKLETIDTSIAKINSEIRDNQMKLEQNIFDTIVDAWEANIDALEEQKELIEEANNAYTEGLRDALDAERKTYEDEASVANREQLQRELSLLRRSGGSASEIADLEGQIDNALKDEYFKSQEDMISDIEEANKNQIELLEKQITIQEDTLEYQKENGIIWQKVAEILSGTKDSIMEFFRGNNEGFFSKSKEQQIDALNEWSYSVGMYKEDQLIKSQAMDFANGIVGEDANDKGGTNVWETEQLKGYKSLYDTLDDSQKQAVHDAYGTAYQQAISEGGDKDKARAAGYNAVAKQMGNYQAERDAIKSTEDNNNNPDTPNPSTPTDNEYVYVTISSGNYIGIQGKPTINGRTEAKVKAGESVSFNPGAPQGFRFLEWTAAKGTRKGSSTRVKTKKGDGELHVLVYYQRSSSGKYGYKITYTDIATNKTKTEKSAQEYISSAAAISKGEDKAKALGLNDKKKYSNLSIKAYETGGLVDYTGLAMVHGSSSKPEAFLNAEQTAQIKDALMLQTKEGLLSSLQDSLLKFQSTIDGTVSGITSEANNSSINIQPGAVVIQVEELANNYDVEKLSNDVMNRMTAIAAKATNRGVNRR